MPKNPTWLLDYRSATYSQEGEDGVIEAILGVLPSRNQWCVEFGAWDGRHFSNTRKLIEQHDYSAVLIEPDEDRFRRLRANYSENSKVLCVNSFVGFSSHDSLDRLLADVPMPIDFDFLSIDVDGNDFHIWSAISTLRPKVVCIEFNPTIPNEVDFVQEANPSVNQGSSITALVRLAHAKGYELVCALQVNALFVDAKYFDLFEIADNRVETLRRDLRCVTHVFVGYDGTLFFRGKQELQWHGVPIAGSALQPLPHILRKYPANYNLIDKWLFALFLALRWPRYLPTAIRRWKARPR